jgi:exonuclease I
MWLRIESINGSPVNDYRISGGRVQVRVLDPYGHEYRGSESRWRMLDANDIQLHYALDTVVARWLDERIGRNDFVEKRAA